MILYVTSSSGISSPDELLWTPVCAVLNCIQYSADTVQHSGASGRWNYCLNFQLDFNAAVLERFLPIYRRRRYIKSIRSPGEDIGGFGAEPRPKTNLVRSKLSESHWRQSFWVFWGAYFTAEQSKFSSRHNTVGYRSHLSGVPWRRRSVAQRGQGRSWLGPQYKSAIDSEYYTTDCASIRLM